MGRFANLSPTSGFTDEGFRTYRAVFLFLITIFAGWMSELLIGIPLLRSEHTRAIQELWKFSQAVFPFLVGVAFYSAAEGEVLGLPLMVIGLWKFGFPETSAYLFRGAKISRGSVTLAIADLLNGIGLIVHHSTAAFIACFLAAGAETLTRPLMAAIVPVIAAHLLPMLRYVNYKVYVALTLLVELWFQFEAWSNIEKVSKRMAVASFIFIASHYLFVAAFLVERSATCEVDEMAEPSMDADNHALHANRDPTKFELKKRQAEALDVSDGSVPVLTTPPIAEKNRGRGASRDRRSTIVTWRSLFFQEPSKNGQKTTHSAALLPVEALLDRNLNPSARGAREVSRSLKSKPKDSDLHVEWEASHGRFRRNRLAFARQRRSVPTALVSNSSTGTGSPMRGSPQSETDRHREGASGQDEGSPLRASADTKRYSSRRSF